ncbi:hypothetical protein ACOMHN_040600 [Nucella lapillus]
MAAEFVPTTREGRYLKVDGYLYTVNRKTDAREFWRCIVRRDGCGATAVTDRATDRIIKQSACSHSHEKQDDKIIRVEKLTQLKVKVTENMHIPLKRVYNQAFEDEVVNATTSAPSYNSVRTILYRERKKLIPPLPAHRREVELQGQWTQTLDNEPFLMANDGGDNKLLVFSTSANLQLLSASRIIFMDGTFAVSPRLFTQLYTLHILYMDQMIPLVFALLPDKSQHTYTRLFDTITRLCHERNLPLSPQIIQTDFEIAAIQAYQISFPQSRIRGCFFHFTQSLWRKVQNLGLAVPYRELQEVKSFVRRMAALPLVSLEELDNAWMIIHGEAPGDVQGIGERVKELCDYMVRTWVGDERPLFARQIGSHFDTLGEDTVKTNNHLESYHAAFAKNFRCAHPNIFVLVSALKRKQKETEIAINRLNAGHAPPPKKRATREKHLRMSRIRTQLQNGQRDILSYVDAMSFLVKLH